MNWEIGVAIALVAVVVTVLAVQFWNKSNAVPKAEAEVKSAVGRVTDFAKELREKTDALVATEHSSAANAAPVRPAPPVPPAQEDAPATKQHEQSVAPVTSSDPIAAAHAALDAAIAEAQKALDDAKAKKDTLTKAVTDAVAAAK